MTLEQLEKAKELEKEIYNVKEVIDYLENKRGVELSICYYHDGTSYNTGYRHIITLDDNNRAHLANYYKDILNDLEKQLEEL